MNADGAPRFEVRLRSRRVQKELDALRGSDHWRILQVLHGLAEQPRPFGCKKLYDDVYRARVGTWRIIYRVDELSHRVDVGSIRRRSGRTYKDVYNLFD